MLETNPTFRPIRVRDGYPPLEDLGLIGDGATVALVGLDGSIHWLCLPRFDSEPVFCSLLDRERGGHFTITPDELTEARQLYQPDTGVLVTELRSPTGLVRLTDALALRSGADLTDDVPGGRGELVRSAVVLDGNVRLRVELEPRGGAQTWMAASGLRLNPSRRPDLQLHLRSSLPLSGLHDTYDLKQGDSLDLVLSWGRSHRHHRFDAGAMLQATTAAWRRWMTHFSYEGLQEPLVRRAAITLKLCDHWVNGSLVAAPTSSLPAPVGGVRNWDYRYTWIRDAAFTVFALRRIGFGIEADAFLGWVLDAFEQSRQPRIMYDLDGSPVPDEREDPELEGYRRSAPVRWGNGAADQRQHDVYGEILDCADPVGPQRRPARAVAVGGAGPAGRHGRRRLAAAGPGHLGGTQRGPGLHLFRGDVPGGPGPRRGHRRRLDLPGPVPAWRSAADKLRQTILDQSWDEDAQTLSEHLNGGGSLDASLLALPLRRVLPAATHAWWPPPPP